MRLMVGLIALSALALPAFAQPPGPVATPVSFPAAGEEPPQLEGELSLPDGAGAEAPVPGVVICHPNPLMGGNMRNSVVAAMRDRCLAAGIATLIFNFRGVGRSEGERIDTSVCADDVRGALAFLRAQPAIDARRCGLAGYSFGSQMALMALQRDPIVLACAAVGFPTGLEQPAKTDDFAYLRGITQPLLFVTGTEDQYSSVANIAALVAHYELQAQVLPVEGADHFFAEDEARAMMAARVAEFLTMRLIGDL